jgi:beta-glucosidase
MSFNKTDFGTDFRWGVSTAAYQVEGAYKKHGKGLSIWDIFTADNANIKDGTNANKGCNHYKHYKKDIKLIKKLNISNYRFSLSWPRILPEGIGRVNQRGLDFYNRLIDRCLEKNITPWITLYHWDLPQALEEKGGWINRDILNWFGEYAEIAAVNFGDRVKNWIVLNEPATFTGAGYFLGYHAPGKKGINNFLPAMHHAMLCQGKGGSILRERIPLCNVGTSFSTTQIDCDGTGVRAEQTKIRFDILFNRLFIEPVLGLGYPVKELDALKKVEQYMHQNDEKDLPFDFDFIGLQNYTREVVKYNPIIPYVKGKIVEARERKVKCTHMGWEIYPEAIYNMLQKLNSYGKIKEFIVTENGASFADQREKKIIHDPERIEFLKANMKQVLRAKNDRINVTGYFIWTLMDNFEWAEGYRQRFGLIYTNFTNRKRYIKDSGYWLAEFLADDKA